MSKSFLLPFLSVSDPTSSSSPSISQATGNFLALYSHLQQMRQAESQKLNELPDELQIHDFSKSIHDITLFKDDDNTIRGVLPRFKKILKEDLVKTKWEKFAQQKGIQKKKRSRMVFDEVRQDWVPRWGARSIKKQNEKDTFAIEEKFGDGGDPFAKKGLEKELKNERTKLQQMSNEKLRHPKKEITKKTLEIAQLSTASVGRFDKKAHKEEKKPKMKKEKKKIPLDKSVKEEKDRYLNILSQIGDK